MRIRSYKADSWDSSVSIVTHNILNDMGSIPGRGIGLFL
jgi:hypothetical protein